MSIHKRSTQRKGNVYEVRVRDPEGREVSRTFRTLTLARDFEREQQRAKSRGSWIDPAAASMTFREWSATWLRSNPGKRPSSWARDEVIVRRHLVPELGPRRLGSITKLDVQQLVNSWTGAPRTVKRQYGVLRAIMNAAVDADLIGRTPCRAIDLPEVHHDDRQIVTGGELERLADELGPDYGPMAYLGVVLGLRWGECAGLRVGRLDFLRGEVAVLAQITRGPHGAPVEGAPKSAAGRRTLTAPPALMAMLSDLLARRGLTGADADELVFTAPEGGPLRYEHWRHRQWLPATVAADLPGLRFHDLRKANATGLVAEGVDLKVAQARLGHTDPRLTLAVYAQATSDADRAAADRMGDRFMPGRSKSGRGKNAG